MMQVKASMLGRAIKLVKTPELVAVGAALLAGQAGLGCCRSRKMNTVASL